MISTAIFLSGCNTVHEYKDKVKALSKHGKAYIENKQEDYEIAECFAMKYEDFIYLCNHINERFAISKKVHGGGFALKTTMLFCNRADKVLFFSFANNKVAVLYNAGNKVEVRPWCNRARDLRNAEKRRLKELQDLNNMI